MKEIKIISNNKPLSVKLEKDNKITILIDAVEVYTCNGITDFVFLVNKLSDLAEELLEGNYSKHLEGK